MPTCQLSDYESGPVLGAGTVGTIILATDRKTGERVAIKKLHPSVSEDELIRARFRREMSILERMGHHPNVVGYHCGGEADGILFYVMEVVAGGTVKELLSGDVPLSWPSAVWIGQQICSALQCAHNHGVVHRDLKPGNLFLTKAGEVKLGDFGIARDLHNADLTAAGQTVGTRAYMAPEQITGDDTVSGKADLYALGCCLYEMLTARQPFYGNTNAELFEQHLRSDPPRVRESSPSCPEELDDLVHQLLAKDPEHRPFNARKVQGELLRLGDEPAEKRLPPKLATAPTVMEVGQQSLIRRINSDTEGLPSRNVSWKALVALMVVVAIIAAAAVLTSK